MSFVSGSICSLEAAEFNNTTLPYKSISMLQLFFHVCEFRLPFVNLDDVLIEHIRLTNREIKNFGSRLISCQCHFSLPTISLIYARPKKKKTLPIVNKSLKPFVINSAQGSPFLSRSAFVATVVPIRTLSIKIAKIMFISTYKFDSFRILYHPYQYQL